MPVLYDGNKIIPAPYIGIATDVDRKGSGQKRKGTFTLTVSGTIHAYKGSPNRNGIFYTSSGYPADDVVAMDSRQDAIQTKIGALINLFKSENKWFEIQAWNGAAPVKCQARTKSMSFDNGPWVDVCNYQIVLECECIFFGTQQICATDSTFELVDETWEIEPVDETMRAYRLTHGVSCQLPDSFNADGSLNTKGSDRAKAQVITKLGVNGTRLAQLGVLNLTLFNAYNHARQVSQSDTDGTYRVTETWVCFQPGVDNIPAIEDYTLTTREVNGLVSVSVNGTINGLFERDASFNITKTKLQNAQAKWAVVEPILPTRAQSGTTAGLNPVPISRQKVENSTQGIISYDFEYNSRSNFGLTGVKSVEVNIQQVNPADVFASITVINRLAGPILQAIGSKTERRKTISIDVILTPISYSGLYPINPPDVTGIIAYYAPVGFSQIFLAEDNENLQLGQGRYQRVVSFVYQ